MIYSDKHHIVMAKVINMASIFGKIIISTIVGYEKIKWFENNAAAVCCHCCLTTNLSSGCACLNKSKFGFSWFKIQPTKPGGLGLQIFCSLSVGNDDDALKWR